MFPLHLLFPLAASVLYVAGVLLVKRSAPQGVGLWRTAFVSNVTMGVCFAPMWLLGGTGQSLALAWQPLLAALAFFIGQVLTFKALDGDVSVATPVLGLKILLVACFSTLLLEGSVPWAWWIAAALGTLSIALLGRQGRGPRRQHTARAMVCAALAAIAFALADVLVQKWAPAWGAGRFLPLMFGLLAVLSLGLIPAFRAPLRSLTPEAWRWLLPGAVLLALQAAAMAWTLAVYGDATAVNVVYSSRGLWSVLAVWGLGHWFANDERSVGSATLRLRLIGAILMLAAIGFVLVGA